ncbi:hypothetical protein KY360_05335 [Candidatus Woesearchaeota archaeon]|nr:hypothetical protein [Candidatus Woesearchaeota archaeon]
MKEVSAHTFAKIKIGVAVTAVLALSFYLFSNPNITGYVSIDFIMQDLDITLTQSQVFTMGATNPQPFTLTSFKLSGEVIGDGRVEIYLENRQGQQLLIYRNIKSKDRGISAITGLAVEGGEPTGKAEEGTYFVITPGQVIQNPGLMELSGKEETISGPFSDECVDTCFIRMELSSSTTYGLVFKVEPGTTLKIDRIFYTIDTDE